LLTKYGYDGDKTPLIRGDALSATKANSPDDPACACIGKLMKALIL